MVIWKSRKQNIFNAKTFVLRPHLVQGFINTMTMAEGILSGFPPDDVGQARQREEAGILIVFRQRATQKPNKRPSAPKGNVIFGQFLSHDSLPYV